jgi:hypothetical protein
VFQTAPPRGNVTLEECAEAMHACRDFARTQDRVDYCASLGIDYLRVVAYHDRIQSLERLFALQHARDVLGTAVLAVASFVRWLLADDL